MGWNNGLKNEMPKNTTGATVAGGIDNGLDLSFKEKNPPLTKILFGDDVTKMVKDGNLAAAFGLLYKWGFYLTMDRCILTWAEDVMVKFIVNNGF